MSCYKCGGEGGTEVILCPSCRNLRINEKVKIKPPPQPVAKKAPVRPISSPDFEVKYQPSLLDKIDPKLLGILIAVILVGTAVYFLRPYVFAGKGAAHPGSNKWQAQEGCTDRCGDGRCDEPSTAGPGCVGEGCPCFEFVQSCPADCSETLCVPRCGDGKCARHPCRGRGCSCQEDHVNCPKDCCEMDYRNGVPIAKMGCTDE